MDNVNTANNQENSASESKSGGSGFLNFLKNIVVGFFSFIFKAIKAFVSFFFDLKFAGKISFLIILVVFTFFGFIYGRNSGKNSVEDEVQEKTGYEVDDLGDLMKEINRLETQIRNLRVD
jgi:hypothetical protein